MTTQTQQDWRGSALLGLTVCLVPVAMWAMTVGRSPIPLSDILSALTGANDSREDLIVATVRLPRVLAGVIVGASLAMAGAIMQAVTANPLASPALLGVNSGAAFAVVLAMGLFGGGAAQTVYIWWAFAGAAGAAVIVYGLGSAGRGGATPLRLALAGAVAATFLGALTTAMLIFDQNTLSMVRLWTVGNLAGRQMSAVTTVAPYVGLGLIAALICRGQIMTLSLGAAAARTVGQNLILWRGVAAGIVVLLAGGAVALAGPVAFVGLIVPHAARMLVGADYRWILPYSAVMGALLVVVSDAVFRVFPNGPDLPVGITMALLGAPFFIYLARYRIGAIQ